MADRDPIALFGQRLQAEGLSDAQGLEEVRRALTAEMDAAVEFAMNTPYPDPGTVDGDVYA